MTKKVVAAPAPVETAFAEVANDARRLKEFEAENAR